jgi:hypothetical protein
MTRMHLGVMANDETQESVDLDSNEILFVLNNFYVYSIHIYSSPPHIRSFPLLSSQISNATR